LSRPIISNANPFLGRDELVPPFKTASGALALQRLRSVWYALRSDRGRCAGQIPSCSCARSGGGQQLSADAEINSVEGYRTRVTREPGMGLRRACLVPLFRTPIHFWDETSSSLRSRRQAERLPNPRRTFAEDPRLTTPAARPGRVCRVDAHANAARSRPHQAHC
jgi:hypothetical protein